MTKASHNDRRPRALATVIPPKLGEARRAAVSAIVVEHLEAFVEGRRSAQRGLVYALERAETASEIQQRHSAFAVEAARVYAAHALLFNALADELACNSIEGHT